MKDPLPVAFDLNDFRQQIVQMKKMGSIKELMGKIPGMKPMDSGFPGADADGEVKRIQGIIDSMTMAERANPHIVDIRRKRRIAAGAGVDPSDISSLVKQFDAVAAFVKQMASLSMMDKVKMMMGLGKAGTFSPAQPPKPGHRGKNRRRDRRGESGDRDDDCASPVPRP